MSGILLLYCEPPDMAVLGTYQEKFDHDAGRDESAGPDQLAHIYTAGAPPCQYRLLHSAHLASRYPATAFRPSERREDQTNQTVSH